MARQLLLGALVVCTLAVGRLQAEADGLSDIWRLQDGRSRRVSSVNADPVSNRDFLTLQPGETATLCDIAGPGIIRHIWFTLDADDKYHPRRVILRAWWDDEPTPSIEAPLGDFFAVGNGLQANVDSEVVQNSSDGRALNCFWPMPFGKRARLTLENLSTGVIHALYYYIDYEEVAKLPSPLATFHAQYRQDYPVAEGDDHVFADIVGRGQYVGTVLSWWSVEKGWPGEGDDRFYIDGEEEPSLAGTGTEDYFSDAWGFRLFTQRDHGVTVWEGTREGSRCTAYRWHVRDPIRFSKSLRATIEHRGWAIRDGDWDGFTDRPDRYSSVAFWYQVEPHADFPRLPPADELMPYEEQLVELEDLLPNVEAGGEGRKPGRQDGRAWSNRAQVFYAVQDEGEAWVRIPFEVTDAGRWLVYGLFTASYDYGIWQVSIDDEPVGEPRDMYSPRTHVEEVSLGAHELEAGQHWLSVKTVGRNPESKGVYMGLDALILRR